MCAIVQQILWYEFLYEVAVLWGTVTVQNSLERFVDIRVFCWMVEKSQT